MDLRNNLSPIRRMKKVLHYKNVSQKNFQSLCRRFNPVAYHVLKRPHHSSFAFMAQILNFIFTGIILDDAPDLIKTFIHPPEFKRYFLI